MLSALFTIFVNVIGPILLLIGLGALLNVRRRVHVETLNRMSMYVLVPAFLFVKIYESRISWYGIAQITYGMFAPVIALGVILYLTLRRLQTPGDTRAALLVGGLVFNAGNFGLPVSELFYGVHGARFPGMTSAADGPAVQGLLIMLSNLSVWLLGYGVIAMAKGDGLRGALGFFRLPMIYVIALAFTLRDTATVLPDWLYGPIEMLSVATVPVMLLTLGAQLAKDAEWPRWRQIGPAMAIKLLILPAITALFVWWLGLWPWPGAQLVIAAAAPTAVNTLLLSLELEGDARTAADCVFWTTVASAVTVTGVLMIVQSAAGS